MLLDALVVGLLAVVALLHPLQRRQKGVGLVAHAARLGQNAVLGEHQWIIACMNERAQADVWADTPDAVASSSLAPRVTATC